MDLGIKQNNYLAFGLVIQCDIDLSDMLPISYHTDVDLVISAKTIESKSYQKTQVYRKNTQAEIVVEPQAVYLHWPATATFKISDGKTIDYHSYTNEDQEFKLFLFSEAIGIILLQRDLFVLHASATQINGKGHIFLGEPGAGKSTTAAAFWQAGHTVLTDDLAVLKIHDNEVFLFPAFPQIKIWRSALAGLDIDFTGLRSSFEGREKFLIQQEIELFNQKPVKVSQINILNLDEDGDLPTYKAPVELLKHFPLPNQLLSSTMIRKHFEGSVTLAKSTKIRLMRRPEGFLNLRNFVEHYAAEC